MPLTKGRTKAMFDAAADITLRNLSDGAEVTTAAEAAISTKTLDQAEWDENEIPWDSRHGAQVVVHVTAMDVANADETYVISVEVADDDFTTNVTEVASITIPAIGQYILPLDPETVMALGGTPKYMRVKATLGGTTPQITYGAWLN